MQDAQDRRRQMLASIAWDAVGLVGFGLAVAGLWMIYPPIAAITGGISLLAVSMLMTRPIRKPTEDQR